ncbi:ABC transporter substrate-binding protein [Erythrobacter sp. KY5]|uniref:ABC transporter substrate-binding protein n=1 Tax=Erythrobacter sp. KY5 TaxID=2011159 RepID=UPI001F18E5C6|nr:ABC transporter substrate-binding protein [Erythrobacter sp. KY5]
MAIRRAAKGLAMACVVASLAACGTDRAVRSDEIGATFVSLNPCLDAILVEVADPDQILALSHYSRDPAASSMDVATARQYGVTGGTAEEVIALQPDIVLASTFIAPATKAALERSGLRVETFDSPRTASESALQVSRLGDLTGNEVIADNLARAITTPLWPPQNPPEPGPMWQPEPDPSVVLWQAGQIVAGNETLIADLLREEGFVSHSAALGMGQADHLGLEQILADPPDVLLVAGDSAGQRHPALLRLKDTWVREFDPALFYCGGPSILKAREELHGLRLSVAGQRG